MEARGASRLPRLFFDGDEAKYELWETKVLGYLYLSGLKNMVLQEPNTEEERAADTRKNADAYAELIQLLDDESLSLVMREAADDGRKALKILREYYNRQEIGARNLLKPVEKQREAQQQQLQALIAEKRMQLRYRIEYEALSKVESDQNELIDQFIVQK